MAHFPSEAWFKELQEIYNSDSSLHTGGGGACDTTAAFKIGDQRYRIVFEGLQCLEIRSASDAELASPETDFVIDMAPELWTAMVANIQEHGAAHDEHTLNSIDLQQDDSIAYSPDDDQARQDLFYRFNQNFQDFFDASSRIDTTFD
jgi:hypothetical protein